MKTADLPLPVIWWPQNIAGGWVDSFHFRISAYDGLPPTAQARILRVLIHRISAFRCWFYLRVELDAPGTWYASELERLVANPYNLVITSPFEKLELAHLPNPPIIFEEHPDLRFSPLPNWQPPAPVSLRPSVLEVLQILARLESAQTIEIASQLGFFCKTYINKRVQELEKSGYARRSQVGKYPGWILTRSGLIQAHRSWKIPPRVNFRSYRKEHSRAGFRHREVARMWRAWLVRALPRSDLRIWGCWTEFAMHPGFPDALAWGTWQGQETLFWLEVDTGHTSRQNLRSTYARRFYRVCQHSIQMRTPIVFALLSLPWVLRTLVPTFTNIPANIAVIAEDWRRIGGLPVPEFGKCRVDFELMYENQESHRRYPRQDWDDIFKQMGGC